MQETSETKTRRFRGKVCFIFRFDEAESATKKCDWTKGYDATVSSLRGNPR
jgi:hypothetical protein